MHVTTMRRLPVHCTTLHCSCICGHWLPASDDNQQQQGTIWLLGMHRIRCIVFHTLVCHAPGPRRVDSSFQLIYSGCTLFGFTLNANLFAHPSWGLTPPRVVAHFTRCIRRQRPRPRSKRPQSIYQNSAAPHMVMDAMMMDRRRDGDDMLIGWMMVA